MFIVTEHYTLPKDTNFVQLIKNIREFGGTHVMQVDEDEETITLTAKWMDDKPRPRTGKTCWVCQRTRSMDEAATHMVVSGPHSGLGLCDQHVHVAAQWNSENTTQSIEGAQS